MRCVTHGEYRNRRKIDWVVETVRTPSTYNKF